MRTSLQKVYSVSCYVAHCSPKYIRRMCLYNSFILYNIQINALFGMLLYNIIKCMPLVTVSREQNKKSKKTRFIKFSPTCVVFENPLYRDNSFRRLTCPSFVHIIIYVYEAAVCTAGHSPPIHMRVPISYTCIAYTTADSTPGIQYVANYNTTLQQYILYIIHIRPITTEKGYLCYIAYILCTRVYIRSTTKYDRYTCM